MQKQRHEREKNKQNLTVVGTLQITDASCDQMSYPPADVVTISSGSAII